jgi:hypothetical protein
MSDANESQSGLFDPTASMVTSGDGLYSTGDLVENPPGSGLYSFASGGGPGDPGGSSVLTAFVDAAPCPRVLIAYTSFEPGTAFVTVYRIAGGRTFRVRGAVMAAVAGGLSRFDYEAPFGLELFYRAEMFDASGVSLGFTAASSVRLDVLETWVHNPLDPAGATTVAFRDNALRELTRPSEGQVYYPQGRRVGVVVSGQRRGLSGVVLDLIVDSVAQANKFQAIAGGGYDSMLPPVGCFRVGAADRVRVPKPLFASLLEVSEQDMNYVLGGTQITFAVTGDEVVPPAEALVIPLLTRGDVDAFYNSRAAVKADNLTRGDVSRRYELAGSAS